MTIYLHEHYYTCQKISGLLHWLNAQTYSPSQQYLESTVHYKTSQNPRRIHMPL